MIAAVDSGLRCFHVEGEVQVLRSAGFLYFQTRQQRECPGPNFYQNQTKIESPELDLVLELEEEVGALAVARTLRPGDRIGSSKLKKHLHALGIPRPERRLWPLLVQREGSVVWHAAKPSPQVRVRRLGFPFAVHAPRQDGA
ncbi:MAG: tRNA lysidine(34) synthetase TilS C-terminal domain-containing protein [Bdellovibrionota bacterium]